MTIIELVPRSDRPCDSSQREALDEISHKLMVAKKACRAVCELVQVMAEMARQVEQWAEQPTSALAPNLDLVNSRFEGKLAALGAIHDQLSLLKGGP